MDINSNLISVLLLHWKDEIPYSNVPVLCDHLKLHEKRFYDFN